MKVFCSIGEKHTSQDTSSASCVILFLEMKKKHFSHLSEFLPYLSSSLNMNMWLIMHRHAFENGHVGPH